MNIFEKRVEDILKSSIPESINIYLDDELKKIIISLLELKFKKMFDEQVAASFIEKVSHKDSDFIIAAGEVFTDSVMTIDKKGDPFNLSDSDNTIKTLLLDKISQSFDKDSLSVYAKKIKNEPMKYIVAAGESMLNAVVVEAFVEMIKKNI
jgi:hypothetical protein